MCEHTKTHDHGSRMKTTHDVTRYEDTRVVSYEIEDTKTQDLKGLFGKNNQKRTQDYYTR